MPSMSLMRAKVPRQRTVIAAWAILWMLMVPLVHVHPEAAHHHGDADHVRGGIVHSVFSQDRVCEYTARVHDSSCSETDHQHFQASGHSGHVFGHPEIGFSLLGVSNDDPVGKPRLTATGLPEIGSPQVQPVVSTASSLSVVSPKILFLSSGLHLRAPPFLSI